MNLGRRWMATRSSWFLLGVLPLVIRMTSSNSELYVGAEEPFRVVGPGSGIVAHPNTSDASAAVYTLMPEAPPLK
jgi:hypothetical protein